MGKKQVQALVDGSEISTTKDGWNPKEVASLPALQVGWKPGSATHHSISYGMLLACKDKVEGAYIGDFAAENETGEQVLIPTFDTAPIISAMQNAFIEKYGLDIQTIKLAGNRGSAKRELDAIKEEVANLDPEVLELLKKKNPKLYKKLAKAEESKPKEEDSEVKEVAE